MFGFQLVIGEKLMKKKIRIKLKSNKNLFVENNFLQDKYFLNLYKKEGEQKYK